MTTKEARIPSQRFPNVISAAAIKRHTTDIGDVYNNPVIALDKITQAHNDLVEAIEAADRLKQQGIETARENIAKLGELATEMQQKAAGSLSRQRARWRRNRLKETHTGPWQGPT